MSPCLETFPQNLLNQIFLHLTYHELVKLRSVCKWWYFAIGSILNDSFMSLESRVMGRLALVAKELEQHRADKAVTEMKYRRLNVLKCEVKVMQAIILTYIQHNVYYFTGGALLDFLNDVLNQSKKEYQIVGLFYLIDDYLNHFEEIVEPRLLQKSSNFAVDWFSTKLLNLLNCHLELDYIVTVSGLDRANCRIEGKYEAAGLESGSPLCTFIDGSVNEMNQLAKYIRNSVRCNNFLTCVCAADCFLRGSTDECKTLLDGNKLVYVRHLTKKRSHKRYSNSLSISLELLCPKRSAPKIFVPTSVVPRSKQRSKLTIVNHNLGNPFEDQLYEFSLAIKVVHKAAREDLKRKESILTIVQVHPFRVMFEQSTNGSPASLHSVPLVFN